MSEIIQGLKDVSGILHIFLPTCLNIDGIIQFGDVRQIECSFFQLIFFVREGIILTASIFADFFEKVGILLGHIFVCATCSYGRLNLTGPGANCVSISNLMRLFLCLDEFQANMVSRLLDCVNWDWCPMGWPFARQIREIDVRHTHWEQPGQI